MWEAKNVFWTTSRRSLLAAVAPRSAEGDISIDDRVSQGAVTLTLVAASGLGHRKALCRAIYRPSSCDYLHHAVEEFLGQPKEVGGLWLHDAAVVA